VDCINDDKLHRTLIYKEIVGIIGDERGNYTSSSTQPRPLWSSFGSHVVVHASSPLLPVRYTPFHITVLARSRIPLVGPFPSRFIDVTLTNECTTEINVDATAGSTGRAGTRE